ncbi:MAG: dethiobiotin synthase [Pseudomonadota bacterium]|jgi:dethiobiotin synthetase
MNSLFITATGTDIGKTFAATLLVGQLKAKGRKVHALKPLLTGFEEQAAQASDSGLLLAAMGRPVSIANIDAITPWRFRAPLAPNMAAHLEGRPQVKLAEVTEFCAAEMLNREQSLLIEGVGGVLAPINDQCTVRDWMEALNVPAVLVTGSYLGSISHTLTALEALQSRNIAVSGIVVSESLSAPPLDETLRTMANFIKSVRVLALPRSPEQRPPDLTQLLD